MSADDARTTEATEVKPAILRDPSLILDDRELMEALIAASGEGGRNVVDLRGALVSRLETRLGLLEEAHRTVLAAAYENLAGAAQLHRAVLLLLDRDERAPFLEALLAETPEMLAVDAARLCVETEDDAPLGGADRVLAMPPGGLDAYVALGEVLGRPRVWLRPTPAEAELVWGEDAARLRSEALIALDAGGVRAMLAFGAEDPLRFGPDQGGDLLTFFGGVVERRLAPHLT